VNTLAHEENTLILRYADVTTTKDIRTPFVVAVGDLRGLRQSRHKIQIVENLWPTVDEIVASGSDSL
jgi:hypothetical protein